MEFSYDLPQEYVHFEENNQFNYDFLHEKSCLSSSDI